MDTDGGQHPEWNASFSFSFKPPKITNCKVISTEITKLKIDNVNKYVIIMIREGLLPLGICKSSYFLFFAYLLTYVSLYPY